MFPSGVRTFFWIVGYAALALVELAAFSNFAPLVGLPISYAVFLTAVILLPPREGFWFAGAAGLFRDLIAPAHAASHVLFAFLLFALVRAFLGIAAWDEPLRKITAFAIGGALTPLAAWGALVATRALGLGGGSGSALGMMQPAPLSFIAFWFLLFTVFSVRAARRERQNAFGYL